ncbi:MAG: hypothetical protein KZQ84_18190 [Candidatus Thiodiazotropha sp. (ex Lucinoma borealis)]|nr:hypothetical protein [Candidatus Thiodiazotropha sp. (ex Lucinoma borealis)]
MKYQKLVSEINILLDSAAKKHQKQQTKLKQHIKVFKAEEQKLRKRLNKETSTASRKKLKRELGDMKKVYAMLGA